MKIANFHRNFSVKSLILALVLVLIQTSTLLHAKPPKSWPEDGILVFPELGNVPILEAIKEAKSSVDLALYRLEDPEVVNELIKARGRGLNIRVILQKPNLYPEPFANPKTKEIADELKKGDIETHYNSDHEYILSHYKFMIIDKEYGLVQTLNYDDFNFNKARNFAISIEDKNQISILQSIFDNDYTGKSSENDKEALNWWKKSRIILGPEHQRDIITDLLKSAQKSIYIYQQDLSDAKIGKVLRKLAKEGKIVHILMPPAPFGGIDFNRINQTQIIEGGGEFKFLPKPELYIHAKLILIDPEEKEGGKAYIGSCNLWPEALDVQRELGVETNNTSQIGKIFEVFKKDWEKGMNYDEALEKSKKKE